MGRMAALFAVALAAACGGGGGTLSEKSLVEEAEAIQSAAAEGALLAADAADGRTTGPFLRVHAAELGEEAAKAARKLEQAAAEGALKARAARAMSLAREVEDALARLAEGPNKTRADELQFRLERLAAAAEELAAA